MSEHSHNHRPADFEALYASGQQWSGQPNESLVREVGALSKLNAQGGVNAQSGINAQSAARSAVDVGCGEGADALWLAEQGWTVTAVDPAPSALERMAQSCAEEGQCIEVVTGTVDAVVGREFDLVTCSYVPLASAYEVAKLAALVAPGGYLLWVHHLEPHGEVIGPREGADQLEGFDILALKQAKRHVASGAGAHHTEDVVLLARRLS